MTKSNGENQSFLARTGSAPISWGICEVPGWGHQLPVDRVLSEMQSLGLTATELGSVGYLPTDPDELTAVLGPYGLMLTGGFVPLALHDNDRWDQARQQAADAAALLAGAGAFTFVCCPVADPTNWSRPTLSDDQWNTLYANLGRVAELCTDHGLTMVVHPHVDSIIETADEVQRVLDNTDVMWVLETGHLTIGGFDPVTFARDYRDRVGLVHLKDVTMSVVPDLNNDSLTLMEAVQAGIFPPLGHGDVALDEVIRQLENAGYEGWYVIEQDVAITGDFPPAGDGPVREVATSIAFLQSVDESLAISS